MVDALTAEDDEGRGYRRYASGRWWATFDPEISEWGNPVRVMSGYWTLNL